MTQVTVFQEAAHPEFFPEQTKDVQEPAALVMIKRMESLTVNAASLTCPVQTAYIGPDEAGVYQLSCVTLSAPHCTAQNLSSKT